MRIKIKDMNKWSAIILAVNQIANVIGRIVSLIVLMITMNGIKIKESLEELDENMYHKMI